MVFECKNCKRAQWWIRPRRGVLWISMMGMINGFFWEGKFGKYLFGWLDLSRIFFLVFKTIILNIHGIAAYPGCILLQIKYHQNFVDILFNSSWKFLRFGILKFGNLGVNFWSRDLFGFCWKPYGLFWVLILSPIRSFITWNLGYPPWCTWW